jgi:hypothetical protein
MPNITQQLVNRLNKSCWTCATMSNGGLKFPGECMWWVENKKSDAGNPIPNDIMDKGCSKWLNKVDNWYNK